ncbi:MobC family plasmid mobilization relaxosome protein [Desulfovibrio sp. JC022]|uniref:MobC family plasmid mobilization relaxosome protein n=1 Tax=Desulfovibrio sp. JC022 TaxID=2593642 RepID=UPI0013D528D4|nr:MobC family plasmid mobilization relaxosome protein [Desulfovibrio sp. JC022]NDV23841.1 MobC family plasmid mobilization relaxosome protein [Desulfovibrio sp. JC022]
MSAPRTAWLNVRVTVDEKNSVVEEAANRGMTMGDFMRQLLGKRRVRKTRREREKLLQLARIGNNLNQLARWANTYKSGADSVLILAELAAIERELKCI